MAGTPRGGLPQAIVLLLLAVAGVVVPASAKDYTVGDSSGWKPGVDYTAWAKGKSFAIGDTLSFQYSSSHSVLEVSEADHGACSASNPLRTHQDQSTTVPLTKPGTRYFICGGPGHCASGMKLAITVSGGGGSDSGSAGPAMRATNTKPAAGGGATTTTTDDAGESESSAAGAGARVVTGLLLFVAVGLAALMMG